VVVARALYSASEELREIVGFFFDFHDIRESPKQMEYPMTDLCVVGHVAQSKSLKPQR